MDNLERKISDSIKFVGVSTAIVPVVYMLWFWFGNSFSLSKEPEVWGQFGDFVGGILNPVIAFSAFYWLANSVRLQKIELSETRNALEASQEAQEQQAKATLISTKLQHINIQLEAVNSQILAERAYVNQLIQQAQVHGVQYSIVTENGESKILKDVLPELQEKIRVLVERQKELIQRTQSLAPDLS